MELAPLVVLCAPTPRDGSSYRDSSSRVEHRSNTYDRFVFGMLLKAGSTQAQDMLNSVIHNNVVCDNDMHYCQWAEPGERYVLHQRSHVPSSLVRAVAVRRHQSHNEMADIARLPWVISSTSVFHPAHSRTFKIMLVREPCDYTASLWKFSAVNHHHSRLAGWCAERAGAMSLRHPGNGSRDNKPSVCDKRTSVCATPSLDPSYLRAWSSFVNRTGARTMHWFGFRLASLLLGLDYEHEMARCYEREGDQVDYGEHNGEHKGPPRHKEMEAEHQRAHDDWHEVNEVEEEEGEAPFLKAVMGMGVEEREQYEASGQDKRDAFGTGTLCDTENHAVCPQLASSRLEARLSEVLDHLISQPLDEGPSASSMVDCWVHLETLFSDLRFCLGLYGRRQHAGSALNVHQILQDLKNMQDNGTHAQTHSNQQVDRTSCEALYSEEGSRRASPALSNAVYSRDGRLARAVGYAGCCAGLNVSWTRGLHEAADGRVPSAALL